MALLPDAFLNAYTFGFCERRGFTRGIAWRWSLEELARTTGCNAVILPVCAWQEHAFSTEIDGESESVMDAEDVRAVCAFARELGLKVILKAMVNCRDGYWRAYIRFFDEPVPTEPGWSDWFPAWERHVLRVAEMAEANRADLLCIGCEMVGTDHRAAEWRALAARVRERYSGPLTYNCDKYQEDRVTWWDAMDVISSSGYYPIGELEEAFARIRRVSEAAGKPFMFMECGCPSRGNSQHRPNDWRFGTGTDVQAQAEWYRAFLDAVRRHPFVRGAGWWDWSATRLYPAQTAPDNSGYCSYGKPANDLLLAFSRSLGDSVIRRFREADARVVSDLVREALLVCCGPDYPPELLNPFAASQTPEAMLERARSTHFYVAEERGAVVGCGAIGPEEREGESAVYSFYVLPEWQRRGIGRRIMAALEEDEYGLRANRILLHASSTALPFYRRMGFTFIGGSGAADENGLYRMEKTRFPSRSAVPGV